MRSSTFLYAANTEGAAQVHGDVARHKCLGSTAVARRLRRMEGGRSSNRPPTPNMSTLTY